MNHRCNILLLVLSGVVICSALAFEFTVAQGIAAPAPPAAVPSNVNVINVPGVHVLNSPTVRVQERNWQYRALVIPKAIPGTPEWNQFVERLNGYGQEGWELVNIVESVALMKKGV
jgi:hypothetical protein